MRNLLLLQRSVLIKPRPLGRAQLNGVPKGGGASPLVTGGVQTPLVILN